MIDHLTVLDLCPEIPRLKSGSSQSEFAMWNEPKEVTPRFREQAQQLYLQEQFTVKKFLALSAVLALLGGSAAYAAPYASQIRVQGPSAFIGQNFNISYVLNQDADDVLIEVLDESDAVVASFAGTTDRGANTVTWNLTDDNDEGDLVDEGADFKVRITVDADKPAGWAITAVNQSGDEGTPISAQISTPALDAGVAQATLFSRFRPHSIHVPRNQNLDDFGMILLPSSETDFSTAHAAVVPLNSDLSTAAGDGFASRVLRHPASDGAGTVGSFQDVWGITPDPLNPGSYFISGQATSARTNLIYGSIEDTIAQDPNPTNFDLGGPRAVAVIADGSDRFAFFTSGTGIFRYPINADNTIDVSGGTSPDLLERSDYSKYVYFDSAGNLYWTSRDGFVHRWDNSVVLGATTADSLTAANASWTVEVPGAQEVTEMPNGDIIVIGTRAAGGTPNDTIALYNIGNVADANVTSTLALGDAFFTIELDTGVSANTYAAGVDADAFGNIYIGMANQLFGAIAISPGGETSTTVNAPTSQAFDVILETSADRDWLLYQ